MKNLWILINKYNAFFLFIGFFGFACYLVAQNNTFQRASTVNSSNRIVGGTYAKINAWKSYLHLDEENTQLAAENAALRKQLQYYATPDSLVEGIVNDTIHDVQYHYIVAKVTNNSIHQKNNYITLDKGTKHGVQKGMGVIATNGIVGIVLNVSDHFATVQSLLHSESRISAALEDSQSFGSLVWGDNYNFRIATLKDIPNHVKVREGELVYTSGFSLFPPGILIGKVIETGISGGDSFLDIKIELSTNFHNLQQVYVVQDLFAGEKADIEALNENNG